MTSQPISNMQEENKLLEKSNRQKVLEVEKLSQTIEELEEAVLAGGAAANVIRDYKRQIDEINVGIKVSIKLEECFTKKKTLSLCFDNFDISHFV